MIHEPTQNYDHMPHWREYNAALKKRGSLSFWVDEEVLSQWRIEEKTGKRGASPKYSDLAIATFSTLKSVYGMGGRQTHGFLESLFLLMGVDLSVPDHSTVSRRLGKLSLSLPVIPKNETIHLVVDSTGIQVYAEGEWQVGQHGGGQCRTWRKLHLGVDESTGEIQVAVVKPNDGS